MIFNRTRRNSNRNSVSGPVRISAARGFGRSGKISLKSGLILVLLILALFLLLSGLGKELKKSFIDVRKVEKAVLEDTYDTRFIVLRNEVTVTAPVTGQVKYLADEGQRVSKNSTVCNLVYNAGTSLEMPLSVAVSAPAAGVVSYWIDGYESICNPQVWTQLNVTKLNQVEEGLGNSSPGEAKDKKTVQAGEYMFKIVNNLDSSYLYLEMDEDKDQPIKDNYVDIRLQDMDRLLIRARVIDSYTSDNKLKILLQIPSLAGLEKERILQGQLIKNRHEGFILQNIELVEKEGQTGIYLLNNGRAKWTEVEILAQSHDKVCIAGLNEGFWVITSPKYVTEGQRVFTLKK